jgi:ABC-type glycerol-3-phosphate transport system substrate-binding protein
MTKMKRVVVILAVLLLLAACAQKKETPDESDPALQGAVVSDLFSSPGDYNGMEVVVSGKVTAAAPSETVVEGSFTLDDGTGSLLVVTKGAVPGDNQWVTVRGRVAAPYQNDGGRNEVAVVEAQVQ